MNLPFPYGQTPPGSSQTPPNPVEDPYAAPPEPAALPDPNAGSADAGNQDQSPSDYEDMLSQYEDLQAELEAEQDLNDQADQLTMDGTTGGEEENPDLGLGENPPMPGEPPLPPTTPTGGAGAGGTNGSLLDAILGKLGTPTATGGRGRAPRRPTATDALDRIGLLTDGQSYASMDPASRVAARRALGQADTIAFQSFGSSFRDLSPDKQAQIASQVHFQVNPDDDPSFRRAQAKLESQGNRAQAIALFNQRRDDLWKRQDQLRQDAIDRQDNQRMLTMGTRQPTPMKSSPTPTTPAVSWQTISQALPGDIIPSLTDAWENGSLGSGVLSPMQIQRAMSILPIADSADDFLTKLRLLWIKSGGGFSNPSNTPAIPASRATGISGSPTRVPFQRPPRGANTISGAPRGVGRGNTTRFSLGNTP